MSIEKLNHLIKDSIVNYVSSKMVPKSALIAETFYRELMKESEASVFLNNEKVETQLKKSFTKWAENIFCTRDEFDIEEFTKHHVEIGAIHARVGVPVELVDYGMQIVKDYCFELYLTSADQMHLAEGVVYINKLLDTCLSIINSSYQNKSMDDQRNAQALRLKIATSDLSLECEKIKSELVMWSRDVITHLASDNMIALEGIANIRHSNCGLWFVHKAGLYFPNSNELSQINRLIEELGRFALEELLQSPTKRTNSETSSLISLLNNQVNEICWLLEQIAEKTHRDNNSRDPLTQLLSRRFVDGIFKREISLSQKQKDTFGLLMIDIDDFKRVNDTYGHQVGDDVLRDVSTNILQNVRPTDFCFRYGGEEILVLVSAVSRNILMQKAEQIRQSIQNHKTLLEDGTVLRVTVSIGVAMYDGHPDYQKVISEADINLYKAKDSGKNIVIGME